MNKTLIRREREGRQEFQFFWHRNYLAPLASWRLNMYLTVVF